MSGSSTKRKYDETMFLEKLKIIKQVHKKEKTKEEIVEVYRILQSIHPNNVSFHILMAMSIKATVFLDVT
jgi:hypothetical protein